MYFSGVGNGNPLQYACLGNLQTEEPGGLQSMGSQSRTQLSMHNLAYFLDICAYIVYRLFTILFHMTL